LARCVSDLEILHSVEITCFSHTSHMLRIFDDLRPRSASWVW